MSLRARLVLGIGAVLAALAIAMIVVVRSERDYMFDQLDRQLRTVPRAVAFMPPPPVDTPVPPGSQREDSESPLTNLFIARMRTDGGLEPALVGTLLDDEPLLSLEQVVDASAQSSGFTVSGRHGITRFRVLTFPGYDGASYGVIALPENGTDAAIRRLIRTLAVASAAIVAVLVLIGWWMVRLGLRPIAKVTETADAIAAGERGHRVELDHPRTEAGRLGRAFNLMLDDRDAAEGRLRQFVADASHELRTPLTSIRGYLDVYAQGGFRAEGDLNEVVPRLRAEARRMDDLVEDLLLLASLDQGRPLAQDRVELADVLRDAADDGRAVQPTRAITICVPDELPVRGDERRLRQVIAELVHNAIVHTPEDATLNLTGERRNGEVVVTVADTGPGLEPGTAERVFDRFFRGDPSRSRTAGGAGLGLPIARSLVEAHRGTVTLDTAPGRGCRFRIALPA
jgi:two-component system, OmpR family, sensor kinase